jgi:hypothetical protein
MTTKRVYLPSFTWRHYIDVPVVDESGLPLFPPKKGNAVPPILLLLLDLCP